MLPPPHAPQLALFRRYELDGDTINLTEVDGVPRTACRHKDMSRPKLLQNWQCVMIGEWGVVRKPTLDHLSRLAPHSP